MSEGKSDEKKPSVLKIVAEEAAAAAPGAAMGALTGSPVLAIAGAAGGVLVKGVVAGVRDALVRSYTKRQQTFEQALEAELRKGVPDEAAITKLLAENEEFAEVVFQNFRRALDALDPAVVPYVARLASLYRDRRPDGFLKSFGAVLQEIAAPELAALRTVMACAQRVCTEFSTSVAEITPFTDGQLRRVIYANPLAREHRQTEGFIGLLPEGALRALGLIDRHGLTQGIDDGGADLALTNRIEVDAETSSRVLLVLGPEAPELAPLTAEFFTQRAERAIRSED